MLKIIFPPLSFCLLLDFLMMKIWIITTSHSFLINLTTMTSLWQNNEMT